MNNKATIVTCIFYDLHGTEFGGREGSIKSRYYEGIKSILKMKAPTVIYTWEHQIEQLKEFLKDYLDQIIVLPFDLKKSPLYDKIKSMKNMDEVLTSDRSYDVMYNKFIMLIDSIAKNPFKTNYIYWFDAGLSHCGLFPNKYLNMEGEYLQRYYDCNLFSPVCFDNIINDSEEKVLLINHKESQYTKDMKYYAEGALGTYDRIVGGMFGGGNGYVYNFCEAVLLKFFEIAEEYNIMFHEEDVMTMEYYNRPEEYKAFDFQTWHHIDSGDWVQDMIINKTHFFNIFEKWNNLPKTTYN